MYNRQSSVSHKSAGEEIKEQIVTTNTSNWPWPIQYNDDARSEKGNEEYVQIVNVMLSMDWLRLYQSHGVFNYL